MSLGKNERLLILLASRSRARVVRAELPEVERVRRTLAAAMVGARFTHALLNRQDLRQPFPAGFARRLRGQTVARCGAAESI